MPISTKIMQETVKSKVDKPVEESSSSPKLELLKNLKYVPKTNLNLNFTNENQEIMLRMAKLNSKRIDILSNHKRRKNLQMNVLYCNTSQDQIENPIVSSVQEEKLKKNLIVLKLPTKGLQNIVKKNKTDMQS